MKQLFIVLLALPFTLALYAQSSACEKAEMLLKTIEHYHFQPVPQNEGLSKIVYNRFIDGLDPLNMVFIPEDLASFNSHKTTLITEISEQDCALLQKMQPLYKTKLESVLQYFKAFEKEQWTYHPGEVMNFKPKAALNEQEIRNRWKNYIKYLVLEAYVDQDSLGTKADFNKEAEGIKKEMLENEKKRISNRLKSENAITNYLERKWLQAIASSFDENTSFFTPTQEKMFTEELSEESLTFGFGLKKNSSQEVEIAHIVPGSPAWDSNQLNEGDVILSLTTLESKEYELENMLMSEITELMLSDLQTATFSIRKANKKLIQVELSKEIIDVESNVIQSFVVENQQKYGYIYLPSFYTGDSPFYDNSEGCANDLTRNLIRLKREGIEGLILDLRNNGGGSMLEAALMTGIFIDHGSIVQTKEREGEIENIKDINRGTIFNKPLILLTNHYSASASELLANTLKSYNRAVIVGAPTYGKSTIQNVLPIDAYNRSGRELIQESDDGYVRITIGAFFNVDGTTHHKTGVKPDIELPHFYHLLDKEEDTFQPTLSIQKIEAAYYKPLSELPIQPLKEKSKSRVSKNEYFNQLNEFKSHVSKWISVVSFPLDYDGFKKRSSDLNSIYTDDIEDFEVSTKIKVELPQQVEKDKMLDELMLDIQSDETVIEATHILNDLINQK